MAVAMVQQLAAQQYGNRQYGAPTPAWGDRVWVDLQVVQHMGLNKWNDVGYANAGFPKASVTEFRGVFNVRLHRVLGLAYDMGVGVMPAPDMKTLDIERMPMPNNGTQYYLRETVSEADRQNATAHFMISVGLFGDFRVNDRLSVMPYVGWGGVSMPRRTYRAVLKENGSNMQYDAKYVWGLSNGEIDEYYDSGGDSDMMGKLSCRMNFSYEVNHDINLLVGFEYTHFTRSTNFYGRYTNSFNQNVRRSFDAKGNKMNMLGVSVGLSFR